MQRRIEGERQAMQEEADARVEAEATAREGAAKATASAKMVALEARSEQSSQIFQWLNHTVCK